MKTTMTREEQIAKTHKKLKEAYRLHNRSCKMIDKYDAEISRLERLINKLQTQQP